jgi:hypothetical protein
VDLSIYLWHMTPVITTFLPTGSCFRAQRCARCYGKCKVVNFYYPFLKLNMKPTFFRRDASTHRAWQELPRHLRRRAASHNSRRVPVRLREKANNEVGSIHLNPHPLTLRPNGKLTMLINRWMPQRKKGLSARYQSQESQRDSQKRNNI